jgi:hypothetical protein
VLLSNVLLSNVLLSNVLLSNVLLSNVQLSNVQQRNVMHTNNNEHPLQLQHKLSVLYPLQHLMRLSNSSHSLLIFHAH